MIIQGNALHIPLKDNSVQCVVTSPPYYSLRRYATAKWIGGDPDCDHDVNRWDGPKQTQGAQSGHAAKANKLSADTCSKCGAIRVDNQIGLESTIDEYIDKMVQVFREVRRVLRPDGVCWLNLGDSYSQAGTARDKPYQRHSTVRSAGWEGTKLKKREIGRDSVQAKENGGLKPKEICGIPFKVAFALQDDGWFLRQDIVWQKPSPMPESVTDRCSRSHEYIFLLTKSARYFYDAEAVKEPVAASTIGRGPVDFGGKKGREYKPDKTDPNFRNGSEKWGRTFDYKESCANGRNRRSVWTIPSQNYKGAHFATYPEKLVEPCVLAGSRPGDVVLDPFNGSGTSGVVAERHGRDYVGIELSWDYIGLTKKRMAHNQMKMQ